MTYSPIMIPTETGNIEVVNRIQAMRMIVATCYSHQLTKEEIEEYPYINELANHFNLDVPLVRTRPSHNREAAESHGYFNEYYFEEEV